MDKLCGQWMPLKQTTCGRTDAHDGPCRSLEAMERQRQRKAEHVRIHGRHENPVVKQRWNQAYRLTRYGLTQEGFDRLLEVQGYACGMCHEPFAENQAIFIDHDHACCPREKRSCGTCIRGLLCLSCNTALGHIERKYELARTYLASSSGVGRTGFEPVTFSVSGRRAPAAPTARDASRPPAVSG
jgi:hypothetical protein